MERWLCNGSLLHVYTLDSKTHKTKNNRCLIVAIGTNSRVLLGSSTAATKRNNSYMAVRHVEDEGRRRRYCSPHCVSETASRQRCCFTFAIPMGQRHTRQRHLCLIRKEYSIDLSLLVPSWPGGGRIPIFDFRSGGNPGSRLRFRRNPPR
jgi:hypothetical protein